MTMEPPPRRQSNSLFDVFLRLRPSDIPNARFLDVEETDAPHPTHITVKPSVQDSRKRAVERFAFTRVFEEDAHQMDLFTGTGVHSMIEGVLGGTASHGRDGLLATLGVTGSGKSHTVLGTKTQRGLTQMALDVLFQSTGDQLVQSFYGAPAFSSLAAADVSEANMFTATAYLDAMYADNQSERAPSRAATSMLVGLNSSTSQDPPSKFSLSSSENLYPILRKSFDPRPSAGIHSIRPVTGNLTSITRSIPSNTSSPDKKDCSSFMTNPPNRSNRIPRPSSLPQSPSVEEVYIPADPSSEYAIVLSMYEVYNDRIYDLLSGNAMKNKNPNLKRRALLFKSTEQSPDRKVVAGLTKIICGSFEEAMMVLETGLMERKVAGTGSNAVSSRSHGFFCMEVKKRNIQRRGPWSSSTLTIVDLAGSERARNAKTAGATLAEAGKINESLMYLGQCMQMQSDNQDGSKNIVPFRQCKLTELLFSNSFPSTNARQSHHHHHHRQPQKSVMIVTADPKGDFNATSQILRYSALAREVTVPRIPSITSTILAGSSALYKTNSNSSGRNTPSAILEELEASHAEIAHLASEVEIFALRLSEETARRKAAENSWATAEQHMEDLEQEIRDECFADTEAAVDQERRRWQAAWDAEQDSAEMHMDKKIDVVIQATRNQMREQESKNIKIFEDPEPSLKDRVEELERENELLRARLEANERETMARSASPVKKMRVLKQKKWVDPDATIRAGLDMDLSD